MTSDEEYEEPGSDHGSEKVEEGSEGEGDVTRDVDEEVEDEAPAPIVIRGRGRGRPRGRPRGSGRGARVRGTGSSRGSKRSGLSITLKNPNFNPALATNDDTASGSARGDGDDSNAGTPGGMEEGDAPEIKMYREVGGARYEFTGEELVLQTDPAGETKIDELGHLQGGRVFKGSAFTSSTRPNSERQYILSIEAARATGYRDSLYYFRRNPLLIKLTLTQQEKDILIERKILSQNLKSRIVTMVTAKTAFMVGGAKMIRDGKWVEDDYYEDKAREECLAKGVKPGDPVGEVGDITFGDREPPENRNKALTQAVTTSDRASAVYKAGGPTTFFGGAGQGPFAGEMSSSRRAALSRDGVTEENWMAIAAASIAETNEMYSNMRRQRLEHGALGTAAVGAGATLSTGGAPVADTLAPFLRKTSLQHPQEPPQRPVTPTPGLGSKDRNAAPTSSVPPQQPISTAGLSQAALRALNIKRPGFTEDGSPIRRVKKKIKVKVDTKVKGVYEPHTGFVHYRADTQPTRSKMERIYGEDSLEKVVLGGTNVGSNAWGVAWVDTYAEFRDFEAEKEAELSREFAAATLS